MAKRIVTRIDAVTKAINNQLSVEYQSLGRAGRAMQREGFVGGYLQALNDVKAAMQGYADQNSRFTSLWEQDK